MPDHEHQPAALSPAAPLNPVLRGWCAYFRPGVSSATFSYLAHPSPGGRSWPGCAVNTARITWKALRRRYCGGGWQPADGNTRLLHHRDDQHHPVPIPGSSDPNPLAGHGMMNTHGTRRDLRRARCPVTGTPGSGGSSGRPTSRNADRAPRADLTSSSPRSSPCACWCSCSARTPDDAPRQPARDGEEAANAKNPAARSVKE